MREIREGIYAVDGTMPCLPDIVPPYLFSSPLGSLARENAATRLLSFSKAEGEWVGVSFDTILSTLKKDFEIRQRYENIAKENNRRRVEYEKRMSQRRILAVCTVGLYLLKKPPTLTLLEEPIRTISWTMLLPIESIMKAFEELILGQWIHRSDSNVLVPTRKLILMLCEKRNVKIAA